MLIALAGCDGAGKTTQIEALRARLSARGYCVSVLDKWDVLDTERFPECRFLRPDLGDLKACIADMEGVSRAMIFFWTLCITLTKDRLERPDRIYLLDGHWMKHAAGEIALGCDPDWVLMTVRQMPRADVTIYLDIPPEDAFARKSSFTLMECGRDRTRSREAFLTHQRRMRERLLAWSDEMGWVKISALQATADIEAAIDGVLAARLPPPPSSAALPATRSPGERCPPDVP
ncbi:MAG TPA: hypothetical protein VGD37_19875 [Kofleriaceae bacterium]